MKRAADASSHGRITTVAFDADDTLWHNERVYRLTQERFATLLASHAEPEDLAARLLAAERRNLGRYGFGAKGFVLSMIETALEVTGDRVPARVIRSLVEAGHDMLEHPVELLPGARATVEAVARERRLLLITKGDLLDQERKLAQSGLGDLFDGVEIVSEKTEAVYARIFARIGDGAERSMMVGNSLRSDVLPALAAGAWAVHVPHELTWDVEHETAPGTHPRFREAETISLIPDLVNSLDIEM